MYDQLIQLIQTSGGFSRTNQFRVEIDIPDRIGAFRSQLDLLNLYCFETELPGFGLDTTKSQNGPSLQPELVSDIGFQEITMNFFVSSSFRERLLFEEWRKLQIDSETKTIGFFNDYIGEVSVYPMKRGKAGEIEANTLLGCRLINAYPKTVGSIRYSYNELDQIAILPVTFYYKNYELI